METEPYFPPHWKKKCFCQSRHLISLLSSSNLLTFQANLFLLCYLSFSQDLSLCRACLKPANVVIIKMAFKICLNKKDFNRIQYFKSLFFKSDYVCPLDSYTRSSVGSILASRAAATGLILGVPEKLMLSRFLNCALLIEWTVKSLIVDRTHLLLVSSKLVLQKRLLVYYGGTRSECFCRWPLN